jgi:hypothetical protein
LWSPRGFDVSALPSVSLVPRVGDRRLPNPSCCQSPPPERAVGIPRGREEGDVVALSPLVSGRFGRAWRRGSPVRAIHCGGEGAASRSGGVMVGSRACAAGEARFVWVGDQWPGGGVGGHGGR